MTDHIQTSSELSGIGLSYRERQVIERRNAGEDAAYIAKTLGISVSRLGWIETLSRRKIEGHLRSLLKRRANGHDNLTPVEAKLPLRFNGLEPAEFIKLAYGLGKDLSGPGRYDLSDPVQRELRQIRDWITMAERDALESRRV